jgi:primosomal protein N' (replication factor Y) (superfamily II helicase)
MSDLPLAPPALYADVIVPRHLRRTFTYSVPATLQDRVRIGSRVEVPFGSSRLQGLVTSLSAAAPELVGGRSRGLRAIGRVLDETDRDIPAELFELARLVSERYLTPWGQCLRLILPASPPPARKRTVRQSESDSSTKVRSGSFLGMIAHPAVVQSSWWDRFNVAIEGRQHDALLAIGPPSSRTATILQACEESVNRSRPAIVVVPEISRAKSIAGLAAARWGDRVTLVHSALAGRERLDAWRRIRRGQALVVIGTRLAVFAPFDDRQPIGLVCVDGEEDPSLKDEQEPRYHAREVAVLRAQRQHAVLLLASSHPSLEVMSAMEPAATDHVVSKGDLDTPPSIQLVDLRQVPADMILSAPLLEALRRSVQAETGAVFYLNRKGFASALWCRDCGSVPKCDHCSVTLRYYHITPHSTSRADARESALTCLYCGASWPVPDTCAACLSARLQPVGYGTARVEEEVRRLFPRARIVRLDSDTTRTAGEAARLWRAATVGAFDILIGTQMLFGGPPLPRVGLVGIPNADAGLHVPDFRSAERTYHALVDAASLSRSPEEGGSVLLQTHLPSHHVMAALTSNQPSLFYEHELAFRRMAGYPPFSTLINLTISGSQPAAVQRAAEEWAKLLRASANRIAGATVLGPIPASVSRLRGRYRWQMLVKASDGEAARQVVKPTLIEIEATSTRGIKFDADVDPVELL